MTDEKAMKIPRYDFQYEYDTGVSGIRSNDDGDYVDYYDHLNAIESKQKRIKELELALSGKSQFYCQCGGVKNEWKLIDSAPAHKEILVSGFSYNDKTKGRFVTIATMHYEGSILIPDEDIHYPTHYMELPEPPLSTNPDTNKP